METIESAIAQAEAHIARINAMGPVPPVVPDDEPEPAPDDDEDYARNRSFESPVA